MFIFDRSYVIVNEKNIYENIVYYNIAHEKQKIKENTQDIK